VLIYLPECPEVSKVMVKLCSHKPEYYRTEQAVCRPRHYEYFLFRNKRLDMDV